MKSIKVSDEIHEMIAAHLLPGGSMGDCIRRTFRDAADLRAGMREMIEKLEREREELIKRAKDDK
mgnify:CR=1 FL=1